MRTDSVNISKDFKYKLKNYINKTYGDDYSFIRNFKNKIVNSQEAHEAVRITNPDIVHIILDDDLKEHHSKLYNMIWKRTIACQMKEAKYKNINIIIKCSNNTTCSEYIFKYNKSFLIEKGYLIVYNKELQDYKSFLKKLKNINYATPILFSLDGNISEPKSLYNEITLIKKLEKEGIGRPSTYASIVDKLFQKKYVIKGRNPSYKINITNLVKKTNKTIKTVSKEIKSGGKNTDLLVPTELGINSIEYLKTIVPFILNINFTMEMEKALDKISQGEITKENILQQFYDKILPVISQNNIDCNKLTIEKNEGIIKTKYGYCYYHKNENRYTNIESYLTWKKKNVDKLEKKEIDFLASLPFKLKDNKYLHIGKYGLYLKHNDKNIKLDKKEWNSFI